MSDTSSAGAVVVVVIIILMLICCCYSKHRRAWNASTARSSSPPHGYNPPTRPDRAYFGEDRRRPCNYALGLNCVKVIDQSQGLWFDRTVNTINDRLDDVERGILNGGLKGVASLLWHSQEYCFSLIVQSYSISKYYSHKRLSLLKLLREWYHCWSPYKSLSFVIQKFGDARKSLSNQIRRPPRVFPPY